MDREKFGNIIQNTIENDPLKELGLKLLGTGADKMVFETPGSDRKIIKVSIHDVVSQVLKQLEITSGNDKHERLLQTIEEHKKIEEELAETFGQEHLLRNGTFKAKIPITKDVMLEVLKEVEYNEKIRSAIKALDSDDILEIETVAETQIKAKELINPVQFQTADFKTCLIISDEFRSEGEVSKALILARESVDKNFLHEFDGKFHNEKYREVVTEILTKTIQFTKKTGLMLDIFGPNNITIFTKEDGTVDYHLLDVILPGPQEYWAKNIKDDPNYELLRHYYIFYYSINSLADKLGTSDNLAPEDLIYFKGTGIPTDGHFLENQDKI